jgi:hypothetical protein
MGIKTVDESELHAELRPVMFSIAYHLLGSVSEAEDVVQEAFLRFHDAIGLETDIESPRAYLSADHDAGSDRSPPPGGGAPRVVRRRVAAEQLVEDRRLARRSTRRRRNRSRLEGCPSRHTVMLLTRSVTEAPEVLLASPPSDLNRFAQAGCIDLELGKGVSHQVLRPPLHQGE